MEEKKKTTTKKKKVLKDAPVAECVCIDAKQISPDIVAKMNLESELASKNEELALMKQRLVELNKEKTIQHKKLAEEYRDLKSRMRDKELLNMELNVLVQNLQDELDVLRGYFTSPWYTRLFKKIKV